MLEGRYYSHKDASKMLGVVSSCRLSREKSDTHPMVNTGFPIQRKTCRGFFGENPRYSTLTLWSNTKLDSGKIEFIEERNALQQASLNSWATLDLYIAVWKKQRKICETIPDNEENLTNKEVLR